GLRDQSPVHGARLAEPGERFVVRKKMSAETSRFFEIQHSMLSNLNRVARPYDSFFRCVVQREERRHVGGPGKIEKACGRSVVLHQREPFKIVFMRRHVIQKMSRLSLENSQNTLFLVAPRALVDAKRHEISRQRAVQRRGSIALSSKRPVLVRG